MMLGVLPSHQIFPSFPVEAILVATGFYLPQGTMQIAACHHFLHERCADMVLAWHWF